MVSIFFISVVKVVVVVKVVKVTDRTNCVDRYNFSNLFN